ncbi:MAG: hypothetical protein AAF738_05530 [Bacteroidota bacterium]
MSIFALFCLLTACEDDIVVTRDTVDFGYDYLPLQIGKYTIYEVDSIIYDPLQGGTAIDTSRTYVREEVTDSFVDAVGNTVYTIERSERIEGGNFWQLTDVWGAYNTDVKAVRKEENLEFIKMIFPVRDRRDWDAIPFDETIPVEVAGETLEMFKNWESEMEEVGIPDTVGTQAFEEVAIVQLADSENAIEYRYGLEKYARGVGLVYRELRILDTQNTGADTLTWSQKAEKGFILEQRIVEYN